MRDQRPTPFNQTTLLAPSAHALASPSACARPPCPGGAVRSAPATHTSPTRLALVCGMACALAGIALLGGVGGCAADSFIDPSKVGRWEPTPTTVPILERLAAIEGSSGPASIETSPVRPEDLIPEIEAYRLGPGDTVDIRIQDFYREGVEENFPRLIDPRGFIDLPQLGSIYVDGMSIEDLRQTLAKVMNDKGILRDPIFSAEVTERRRLTFNTIGAVNNPGLYSIPRPDYRLLEALTASGRFPESAQFVYVIRQIPLSDKITRGTAQRPTAGLQPGGPGGAMPTPGQPSLPTGTTPPGKTPTTGDAGTPAATGKPKESVIDLIDELTKPKDPSKEPPKDDAKKPSPSMMPARGQRVGIAQPPGSPPPGEQPKRPEPPVDLDGPARVPPQPAQPAPSNPAGPKPVAPAPTPTPTPTPTPAPAPVPQPPVTIPDAHSSQPTTGPTDGGMGLPDNFWVFRDGKWMRAAEARLLPPPPPPQPPEPPVDEQAAPTPAQPEGAPGQPTPAPPLPPVGAPSPVQGVPGAENLVTQRVIEVPLGPLLAGSAQYNIIIRPGDVIRLPSPAEGIVYITGEVSAPGTFNLPSAGRYTLRRAIASARGLSGTAIPEKVDLTRMIGPDRQATIRLNLRAIEEGTQPDIFLKPDDIINVGTNFWALPLAVIRNGFRASYGYGFVLDRNFQGDVFGRDTATSGN